MSSIKQFINLRIADSYATTVTNFGTTWTDAGFGTAVTPSATANTKGSTTTLISAASITENFYYVEVMLTIASASAVVRRHAIDIMVDPAGGTSWSVLIPNLLVHSPGMLQGAVTFSFPLKITAGSSIGARCQCNTASGAAMRVGVRLFGSPSNPGRIRCGTTVTEYGFTSTGTIGTSYASTAIASSTPTWQTIGTLSADSFWYQLAVAPNDSTMTALTTIFELSVSPDASRPLVITGNRYTSNATEQTGFDSLGSTLPYWEGASGSTLYSRGWSITTEDTGTAGVVYAVSGLAL